MSTKTITTVFPLSQKIDGGYDMITEEQAVDAIKFQLENLLRTIPGEKISDPFFGCGLERYLFLHQNENLLPIKQVIKNQINRYMNFFSSLNIQLDLSSIEYNSLSVRIDFEISSMKISDALELTIEL
jgi:hypothetical protein